MYLHVALLGILNTDLNSLFYYHLILYKIYCKYRSVTTATKIKAFHVFNTVTASVRVKKKNGLQSGIFRNKYKQNCIFENHNTSRRKKGGGDNLQLNGSRQHLLFLFFWENKSNIVSTKSKAGQTGQLPCLGYCLWGLNFISHRIISYSLRTHPWPSHWRSCFLCMQILILND